MNIGNGQLQGKRESQQDYFATAEIRGCTLLILADGIGGLAGGEFASEIAVKAFVASFKKQQENTAEHALKAGLASANKAIARFVESGRGHQGMGTTLVAMYVGDETVSWISVGDSLIYLWAHQSLSRLNQVHTRMVQLEEQVHAGLITRAQAEHDPQKDSITSALQGGPIADTDCQSRARSADEGFLIASDGLSTLRVSQIQGVLRESSNAQTCADSMMDMIEAVNHSAQDNCTALLLLPDEPDNAAPKRRFGIRQRVMVIVAALIVLLGILAWFLYKTEHAEPAKSTNFETIQNLSDESVDGNASREGVGGSVSDKEDSNAEPGSAGDQASQSEPSSTEGKQESSPGLQPSEGNQPDSGTDQSGTSPVPGNTPQTELPVEREEVKEGLIPQEAVQGQEQGLLKKNQKP